MMSKENIFVIFLGLICHSYLTAQSKNWTKSQKNTFWEAESYYIYGDYSTALNLFEELENTDEEFKELEFYIGHCHYQMQNYQLAKAFLKEGSDFNADAHYYLARIHLMEEQLDEASKSIERFVDSREEDQSAISEVQISVMQKNIITAQFYLSDPEVVNIVNLGSAINTDNEEYVPLLTADENTLIFTSRRMHDENHLDPMNRPFEDVYISNKENGNFSNASLLKGYVNSSLNDASVGLSADGNRLFLFHTNENLIGGDLYESLLYEGVWTTPVSLPEQVNGINTIERSASISLDGRTLYFSSNRPEGFGGFDIYKVERLPTGDWSLPINLGAAINTAGDEDSPYIHPNGKSLYFSSTRHENMGGYDIFVSEKTKTSWSVPKNMGYPTNTTKDDIHFMISANEQHGYYASDRKGGFGEHDIYMIDYLEKELRQSVIQARALVEDNDSAVAADISVLELEYGEVDGVYLSHPTTGKFIYLVNPNVEYEVLIEAEGFEPFTVIEQFTIEELMQEQKRTYYLKKATIE